MDSIPLSFSTWADPVPTFFAHDYAAVVYLYVFHEYCTHFPLPNIHQFNSRNLLIPFHYRFSTRADPVPTSSHRITLQSYILMCFMSITLTFLFQIFIDLILDLLIPFHYRSPHGRTQVPPSSHRITQRSHILMCLMSIALIFLFQIFTDLILEICWFRSPYAIAAIGSIARKAEGLCFETDAQRQRHWG